ncbi:TetR/AcrR family transcriptional regulator [Nocardioides sp. CPCC 205120]|uniref:TetR/AcrR family transcriptional regulator n=1 Tax=Nocardioides sp. CPCC 205120 TaxID=3406462 RepID=UPI003B50610B
MSPVREAALAATHQRIVDAAAELFARGGYRATTLAAIATLAGVSVPRVNLSGSKPALLVEAYEQRAGGSSELRPITQEPEMAAIMALPTEEALAAYAAWLPATHARSAGLWFALREAASADAEARAAFEETEARNLTSCRDAVAFADSRGLLTGATPHEDRARLWNLLTRADTYQLLVVDAGWSHERFSAWVVRALRDQVFELADVDDAGDATLPTPG